MLAPDMRGRIEEACRRLGIGLEVGHPRQDQPLGPGEAPSAGVLTLRCAPCPCSVKKSTPRGARKRAHWRFPRDRRRVPRYCLRSTKYRESIEPGCEKSWSASAA
jgi:hypothetical protein